MPVDPLPLVVNVIVERDVGEVADVAVVALEDDTNVALEYDTDVALDEDNPVLELDVVAVKVALDEPVGTGSPTKVIQLSAAQADMIVGGASAFKPAPYWTCGPGLGKTTSVNSGMMH